MSYELQHFYGDPQDETDPEFEVYESLWIDAQHEQPNWNELKPVDYDTWDECWKDVLLADLRDSISDFDQCEVPAESVLFHQNIGTQEYFAIHPLCTVVARFKRCEDGDLPDKADHV